MTQILIDTSIYLDLAAMQQQITDDTSGTIKVSINSFGGSVTDGIACYNMLKSSGKHIVTECLAAAYSAASVVFLAGHERHMKIGAQLMVHDPSLFADLSESTFEEYKALLIEAKNSLLDVYEKETKQSREVLSELMSAESWLSGKRAVELGFATDYEKANVLDNIKNFLGLSKPVNTMEIEKIQNELEQVKLVNEAQLKQIKNSEQQLAEAETKQAENAKQVEELQAQIADLQTQLAAKQEEITAQAEQVTATIKGMGLDPSGEAEKLAAKNSLERLNALRMAKTTKERLAILNQKQ